MTNENKNQKKGIVRRAWESVRADMGEHMRMFASELTAWAFVWVFAFVIFILVGTDISAWAYRNETILGITVFVVGVIAAYIWKKLGGKGELM